MADEVIPQGVAAIAALARVPLDEATAARVARTLAPTVARFAAPDVTAPFEAEPSTFLVVQRREIER